MIRETYEIFKRIRHLVKIEKVEAHTDKHTDDAYGNERADALAALGESKDRNLKMIAMDNSVNEAAEKHVFKQVKAKEDKEDKSDKMVSILGGRRKLKKVLEYR